MLAGCKTFVCVAWLQNQMQAMRRCLVAFLGALDGCPDKLIRCALRTMLLLAAGPVTLPHQQASDQPLLHSNDLLLARMHIENGT